jgi:hypothetical protein
MILAELSHKITVFDLKRQLDASHFLHLQSLQKSFVNDFPIAVIQRLQIDEYIVGKGSNSSFCNRLERQLEVIGRMRGSTSSKFVVYYGVNGEDTEPKYRFTNKLGKVTNEHEAFSRVKNEIIELIELGAVNKREGIKSNRLSDLFKYKILGTYYPDKYLNLYSQRHLNYFIGELGLNPTGKTVLDKQDVLFEFKNSNQTMQSWSNYEFNSFLYNAVGYPPSNEEEEKEKDALPPIDKVKPEIVQLDIKQSNKSEKLKHGGAGKPNYQEQQERNNRLGKRGENIVYNIEKLFFARHKFPIEKLEHSSKTNDRLGYDIKSLDENGNTKYIEVKATRKQKGNANFIITDNEKEKAETLENYYIYIVFEAQTLHPKIWQIKEPFKVYQDKFQLTPINYRVEITVNE